MVQIYSTVGAFSSPDLGDLTPVLLMLALFFVMVMGGLFVAMILRQGRYSRLDSGAQTERYVWRADRAAWEPLFDSPFRWLAIHGADVASIQNALGLRNTRPCSWEEGLHPAAEHRLFISPPVNGWTLVMGMDLPDPADDADESFHFLTRLSSKLGEVQFFSINRLFGHHAWVMAKDGVIERAYAFAGQTVWNQGALTAAEVKLRMSVFDYFQVPEKSFFTHVDPVGATTEKVTALAARWSIDPTTVDFRRMKGSRGISGRFPSPSSSS